MTQKAIDLALSQPYKDFEDSIQYFCVRENKVRSIITRRVLLKWIAMLLNESILPVK